MTLTKLFLIIGSLAMVITAIRYFIQKPLSLPVAFVQNFVGVFFIFSGFVKAIDPMGTSFKIEEYFTDFRIHLFAVDENGSGFAIGASLMRFLEHHTLSIAVVTIVLEIVVGITLLLGYLKNFTVWILLLLIVFFTFLTGYTTYTERVTDCGCFGDFLKIEPKHSFGKDLFLLVLILILVICKKYIDTAFSKRISAFITGAAVIGFTLFSFRNFAWNEPIVDFRPYKIGNYLPDQMKGTADKKEYTWVYKDKTTGEVKNFPNAEFMKISGQPEFKEKWEFVERKDSILEKGIIPKIPAFQILDANGDDYGEDVLFDPEYRFLVIIPSLEKTCAEGFKHLNVLAEACDKEQIRFWAVSNGTEEEKDAFRHENQTAFPFYTGDGTFLKTISRSNPGLLLLKEGKVMGKWHHHHFPTWEELKQNYPDLVKQK